MVRIAGTDLPRSKRIEYALTKIYGIGIISSQNILAKANIDANIRTNDLEDSDVSKIREILEAEYLVETDLKRKVNQNIKRLSEINCVRGRRHRENLPMRGQRTRTNARTRRGAKKTIAGKKK
uniref:Small ribosomal subunit protein uS13c n=1 Tax=Pseudopedinella elastica TaxID=35684 RepID=A0A516ZAI2_9STRA|nr:ribosomal protein S13 [Pseudopedinella elastica]QDR24714.1 ribosomal protein S13 [Pseudopedinella elastica]